MLKKNLNLYKKKKKIFQNPFILLYPCMANSFCGDLGMSNYSKIELLAILI